MTPIWAGGAAGSRRCFWIGSALSFTEVLENETVKNDYPGLWQACKSVGAPQIRNKGTIGGNLANGSPAADSAPPLLALDAKLKLSSAKGSRMVALSDFYLDKGKTVLAADEVIEGMMPLEVTLGQMPQNLTLGGAHYRIEYHPIGSAEAPDYFLVIVTNATTEVEQARAELERTETMALFERVLVDRAGVESFVDETTKSVRKE